MRDFDSYGLVTGRGFVPPPLLYLEAIQLLPRPCWTMPEDVTVSDGQISGLEAHERVRLL